ICNKGAGGGRGRSHRPGEHCLDTHQGKGVSSMPLLLLGSIGVAGTLLLSGCGSSSITVQSSSPAASIVVTGDSTAVTALKTKNQAQLQAGATAVDGDQHSGNHVCGFSVTKNGHSYQVDAYGNVATTTCSSTQQKSFQ